MKKSILIAIASLFIGINMSHAQTITYPSSSQNLTVCSGESLLTVQVSGADTTTNLSIQLPPGIEYIANSFMVTTGTATPVEGGTPNAPTFALTNVSDPFTFTISRKANCAAYTYALGAGVFKDEITIGNTTDDDPLVNPYQVVYPTLTITQPTSLTNVAFGSSHTRTFTFQNNGQGCLDTAYLEIDFGSAQTTPNGNITADGVSFAPDAALSSGSKYVYKIFGTPAFAGGYCDTDPAISVSQPITINGCSQVPTAYKAGWGCDANALCQSATSNGNITVLVTNPNLTSTVTAVYPNGKNCLGSPYATLTAVVKNTGNGPASNITMDIGNFWNNNPTTSYPYVIDTASIKIDGNHPGGIGINTLKAVYVGTPNCGVGMPSNASVAPTAPISLAVNDSLVITWDVTLCGNGDCGDGYNKANEMGIAFDYTTECGVTGTKPAQGISWFGIENRIISSIPQVPAQVIVGSCFKLKVDIDVNISPAPVVRYAEVTITLPTGITINNLATDVIENLNSNQMVPGYPKQVGQDVIARFKSGRANQLSLLLCTSLAACGQQSIPVDVKHIYDSTCATNMIVARRCETTNFEVVCSVPCPEGGVVPVNWTFGRTSFGLPDNNQDGLPDVGGTLDFTKIDLDRYQAGDTLHSYFIGYVKDQTSPGSITNWNNVLAEWKFDVGTWTASSADVTIIRGTTIYTATAVPITAIATGKSFVCNWAAATFTPALPATYIQGDSVIVNADLIWTPSVKDNLPTPSGNGNLENLIGETPENADADAPLVSLLTHTVYAAQTVPTDTVSNQVDGWTCFIPKYNANLLGNRHFNYLNHGLPSSGSGCNDKEVGWRSYTRRLSTYNSAQYFLYEYRPMRRQDSVVVTIPAGWEFVGIPTSGNVFYSTLRRGATMPNINLNGSDSLAYTVTGDVVTGTKITWDLNAAYNDSTLIESTEGSYIIQRFILRPSCATPPSATIQLEEYGFWKHYPDSAGNLRPYYNRNKQGLSYAGTNRPDVVITNNSGIVEAASLADNYWDVQLTGANSNIAPNVWLAIEEFAGANIAVNRVEYPIGTTLAPLNSYGTGKNIYGINASGLVNPNYETVRIYFTKTACNLDSIKIRSGWDCTAFPTTADNACVTNDLILKATSSTSEIQLFKTVEPALNTTVDICSPINYEVRVRSTQNGDIDNPIINIIPPAGMSIVADSFTYSYPGNNNPQGFTIAAVGGKHILNLEDHTMIDSNGINGVVTANNTNDRTAFISYQLEVTSCNFVSGSFPSYEAKANGVCGDPATGDGLVVTANPIKATPQASPASLSATLTSANTHVACSTPITVSSTITSADGATAVGDSVIYTIPSPLRVATGSFMVTSGSVASQVVTANEIKVVLPANASNNPTITFELESMDVSGCDTTTHNMYSTVYRSVGISCLASFGSCQFAEIFGMDSVGFKTKKPELVSQNFSYGHVGNNFTYSLDINNMGTDSAAANEYVVNIYCGSDTGAVLHSFTNNAIGVGSSSTHTGSFVLSSGGCANGNNLFVQVQDTASNGATACICAKEAGLVSSSSPLPVQLLSFDGYAIEGGKNQLNWSVASEENFSHYELQKLINTKYETIEKVYASTVNGNDYSANDLNANAKEYYRLKMVDQDGNSSLSKSIMILNKNYNRFSLYPNPAFDQITVRTFNLDSKVTINIVDAVGKVLSSTTSIPDVSLNGIKLSVQGLATGTYFVNILEGSKRIGQLKFVKVD